MQISKCKHQQERLNVNSNFIINKMNMVEEVANNKRRYPNAIWLFADSENARNVLSQLPADKFKKVQSSISDVAKSMSELEANEVSLKDTLGVIEFCAMTVRKILGLPLLKK